MPQIDDKQLHEIVQRVINQVMGQAGSQNAAPTSPVATPISLSPAPASSPESSSGPTPQDSGRRIVAIGADHGGYELKEALKATLEELGFDVADVGTHSKASVDYPDFAHEVARQVSIGKAWRGIMIDGAGIGSCIVANKVPGVRAGMAYDHSSAVNSREHNNTNVLTLGAGLIGITLAKHIVKTWLTTDFTAGRHVRRVEKITTVEKQYLK